MKTKGKNMKHAQHSADAAADSTNQREGAKRQSALFHRWIEDFEKAIRQINAGIL
jgi:hypothetical protein